MRRLAASPPWPALFFALLLFAYGRTRGISLPRAMALFGGAKLGSSWQAFLFPIVLFCGDLFVGFHRDRKRISPPTILETAVRRHLPAVIPCTHAFCSEDFPFGSVSALPSAAPARHPCPGMAIEPYGALPLL